MQNKMNRVLSLLLVVIMVLSMIPAAFAAEDSASAAYAAENTTTGEQYADLSEAIAAAQTGQTVKALADAQDVVYGNEGVILDLNGHDLSVTVADGVTVSAIDSATDDYAGSYGCLTTDGNVAATVKTSGDIKSYVTIAENGSYSFHRYYAAIAAISLKPAQVALGYRAEFRGDEAVKNAVVSYGYELWVNDNAHKTYTRTDALETSSLTLRLKNILAEGEDALNALGSTATIGGNAFIALELGGEQVKLYGTEQQTTLRQVVEAVNANVATYGEAQLQTVRDMCTTYAAWMEGWNTDAIFGIGEGEGDGSGLDVEITVDVTAQDGILTEDATLSHNGISVTVPQGTVLEEGTTQLVLTITEKASSDSNVAEEEGYSLLPLDVHVQGIAAGNTTPLVICLGEVLPKALNIGNYELYHVENGETVEMIRVYSVSELDAHNEFYYDPATGSVTVAMASFSEITLVADEENNWNGNTDINWYNDTDTAFEIHNADQLAGLGALVDGGETFDGKTVTMIGDINLYGVNEEGNRYNFNPIGFGYAYDKTNGRAFKGTFDGNGNTIYNLYQNCWELGADIYTYSTAGAGLFASVENATIKNLTMDGASLVLECIDMGTVVGYAQGNCIFENIVVKNSSLANYQRYTGGAIGEVSNGHHILRNVDVEASTTVGTLWGDFDASVGGIIGGKWGHSNNNAEGQNGHKVSVYMENCDVAAELDVYNDVTSAYQWYSYRRAGMLIGYTEESQKDANGRTEATADFLETVKCTVQYGDWVNYHYCEFNGTTSKEARYPWVRVEAGKQCGAYSNPRYGVPEFDNAVLNVESHTEDDGCHIAGDGHDVLIVFNQLYGGGQGCYGGNGHVENNRGVTVIGQDGNPVTAASKFKATGVETILTGSIVTLGDLFQAVDGVDIQDAYVYGFVSPVNAEDSVRGTTAVPSAGCNWKDLTITFSGTGLAKVTISDYYYCQPTTIYVNVAEPVVRFHSYNNTLTTATGNTVNLVDPTTCPEGYAFLGWSATPLAEEATEAPEIITGETYAPTAATTNLYAVYSRTETTEGTPGNTEYVLVTDASTLKAGDKVVIVSTSKQTVAGDIGSNTFMAKVSVTISDNTIANLPEDAVVLTLGGSSGAWTLTNSSGQKLGSTAVKTVAWNSGTTTWTISISNGNATIQNGTSTYGRFLYNTSSPRFTTYTSSTSTSMLLPQLYRETTTAGTPGEAVTYYVTYEVTCQHTNTTTTTVDATCQAEGSVTVTCTDCEEVISTQTVPVIDHNYVDGVCSMCGEAEPSEPTESYFTKVTTAPADWSGTYLIVYEDGSVAFNGGLTTLDAPSNTINVTIEENKILADDTTNAAVFTIAKVGEGYSIQSFSGYYIGQTSYNNGLKSSTTDAYANELALDSNSNALISIESTTLKYNSASDQNRFRYYKSGQKDIALYKLDSNQQIVNGVTVTYFENGVENAVTVEKGTAITLPTPTSIPTGYTFVGWTDGDVEYTTTEQEVTPAGDSFTVNSNLEFHALYSRIDIISGSATLVTDLSTLAVGDQVIICATHNGTTYALSTKQNNNNRTAMAVTKGVLQSGIQLLTLQEGAVEGTFAFYTGTGYLYAASSSSNHLKTDDNLTENGSWLINTAGVVAQGDNERNVMQFNYNNNTPIFSCYGEDKTEDPYADIAFYSTSDVVTATYYTTLAQ